MKTNIFADVGSGASAEQFTELVSGAAVRIERIVSHGHSTPADEWYDQPHAEWVLVLRGAARLTFEDERDPCILGPGDCIDIAPHRRHRVDWTDADVPTVWLAVHYRAGTDGNDIEVRRQE